MDQRILKTVNMIQEDVSKNFSLDELAKFSNMSSWHFLRVFKADIGTTPIRYLKKLKLEQAKYLLETTSLNMKEIAYRVGLNDLSHFVRDFNIRYGEYPTAYRLKIKTKNV